MLLVKFVPKNNGESKYAKIHVEPGETLTSVREKVAKQFNVDHFRLLYHGRIIVEDSPHPMTHYKMTPNSTIHVLETTAPMAEGSSEKKPPPSDEELEQFIIAFGLAIRNPQFHKVAQRLGQRENLENIAVTCPDLSKDATARAFLAKPELLYSLLDIETLKYVHEKHPSLCEAAYQLVAAVHEEKPSTSKGPQQEAEMPSAPFAYNLDEMSDEDEDVDDMETGEPARPQRVGRRPPHGAPITADQLASALAAAQSALGVPSGMGGMTGLTSLRPPTSSAPSTSGASRGLTMPSTSSFMSSQQASTSRGGITQDQLAAALALACGGNFSRGSTAPSSFEANSPNYDSQLATMREIGITDTQLARRALSIMSGDLQAAIDLIYSGWKGDDDSVN